MFKKKLKEVIKKIDVFAQPASFRFGEQPQYQTLTGGIISLIMIIFFVSIFYNTVLNTVKRVQIESKLTSVQEEDPSLYQIGTNNFMFAIGIQNIDLNSDKKWFDILIDKRQYLEGGKVKKNIPLNLIQCSKDQWIKLKPQMSRTYDQLNLNNFVCPSDGTIFELQGKFSSEIFKFYKIGVQACTPDSNTNKTCVSNNQIQLYLKKYQAFKFTFYFLNTVINPHNQEYLGTYIQTSNYFLFAPTAGILANFYMSSYQITTDQSIVPLEQNYQEEGGICNTPTEVKNYIVQQSEYIKFYIRKSSLSIYIQRSFRKIDDTLSYIGGLFSAIVFVLFIISKYNQLCYELEVAKNLFHYDKNRPLKSDQFNFFTFIGYAVYCFFDMICIKLPWEKMRRYDESLEQIRKQMDIRLIMKKILYAQRTTIAVFNEPKAKILHLQVPLTLKQAEQIRKDYRFYDKLQRRFFDYKKIRAEQILKTNNGLSFENFMQKQQKQSDKISQKQSNNKTNVFFDIINQINNNETIIQNDKQSANKGQKGQQLKNVNNKRIITRKFIQQFKNIYEQQQDQLEQMIQKMQEHIITLQKDIQKGDIVSKNILNKFDPKLMTLFIKNIDRELYGERKCSILGKFQSLTINGQKNTDSILQNEYQLSDGSRTPTQMIRST